jgi:hypothetical protein
MTEKMKSDPQIAQMDADYWKAKKPMSPQHHREAFYSSALRTGGQVSVSHKGTVDGNICVNLRNLRIRKPL